MVKITKGYSFSCCNSCGKVNTDDIKIINVTVGLDDSKTRRSLGFCNECLKKLQIEINEFFDCGGRIQL